MKTHFSFKHLLFLGGAVLYSLQSSAVKNPVDYVSTLVALNPSLNCLPETRIRLRHCRGE